MLVSGVGEETLQVPGEVRAERTTLSLLVFAASLPAPLCKCLALIQGFGQCKIRTYQPSNWPANKVML